MQQNVRETNLKEDLFGFINNSYFKFKTWTNSVEIREEQTLIYLGSEQSGSKKKLLPELLKNTIWFTYRKKFPALLNEDMISDTRWGCMLRAGQMILANAFRLHLNLRDCKSQADLKDIIYWFLDDDEQQKDSNIPFSIQKISLLANQMYKMVPGQEFSSDRICQVLQRLLSLNRPQPLANCQILTLSADMIISFEKILQKFCGDDQKLCKDPNLIQQMKSKYNYQFDPIYIEDLHQSTQSIILFIGCMLGSYKHQPELYDSILDLMQIKQSIGMLGGQNSRAMYFCGLIDKKLMYLDPHFEQTSIQKEKFKKKTELSTYFSEKFLEIPYNEIQSSISFGFYLRDLKEFEDFRQQILRL